MQQTKNRLLAGYFLGLLLNPEEGVGVLVRNGEIVADYTMLYSER
jgi:hypothetical protein